jgi:hypothetical protein
MEFEQFFKDDREKYAEAEANCRLGTKRAAIDWWVHAKARGLQLPAVLPTEVPEVGAEGMIEQYLQALYQASTLDSEASAAFCALYAERRIAGSAARRAEDRVLAAQSARRIIEDGIARIDKLKEDVGRHTYGRDRREASEKKITGLSKEVESWRDKAGEFELELFHEQDRAESLERQIDRLKKSRLDYMLDHPKEAQDGGAEAAKLRSDLRAEKRDRLKLTDTLDRMRGERDVARNVARSLGGGAAGDGSEAGRELVQRLRRERNEARENKAVPGKGVAWTDATSFKVGASGTSWPASQTFSIGFNVKLILERNEVHDGHEEAFEWWAERIIKLCDGATRQMPRESREQTELKVRTLLLLGALSCHVGEVVEMDMDDGDFTETEWRAAQVRAFQQRAAGSEEGDGVTVVKRLRLPFKKSAIGTQKPRTLERAERLLQAVEAHVVQARRTLADRPLDFEYGLEARRFFGACDELLNDISLMADEKPTNRLSVTEVAQGEVDWATLARSVESGFANFKRTLEQELRNLGVRETSLQGLGIKRAGVRLQVDPTTAARAVSEAAPGAGGSRRGAPGQGIGGGPSADSRRRGSQHRGEAARAPGRR